MVDAVNRTPLNLPLARAMARVERGIFYLEFVTLVVACAALFAIMVLVFLDAVLRYAFNSPLKFTSDIVTLYLSSCALLLVLSYTLRRGGHINVDLFVHILPPRVYDIVMSVALFAAVGVVAMMTYQVTALSFDSWRMNELTVGIYTWPLWPSKAIVAVSLIVLDLRLLHVGLTHFVAGVTGHPTIAVSVAHVEDQPLEDGV